MKEHKTIAGKLYTVTSPNGCTVTDETGLQLGTVEAGEQKAFTATGAALWIDDTAARVTVNFNQAPVKLQLLGLLGGGASTLPSGYLSAEFLESTGTQWIDTGVCGGCTVSIGYELVNAATSYLKAWGQDKAQPNSRGSIWHVIGSDGNFTLYACFNICACEKGRKYFVRHVICDGGNIVSLEVDGVKKSAGGETHNNTIPYRFFKNGNSERLYNAEIISGGVIQRDMIPVLDKKGLPCMFDKITKQPFYNSGTGQFIVGMTLEQARKLGKLPSTGGELTVSLPSNYGEDEGVVNALSTAQENGWVITIQTYEAEAGAASTFALRRIWVRKVQDEQGAYVDSDGTRWQVEWCVDVVGSSPEAEGYEPFRSVEVATEYWGLTEWVDHEQEEILTNTEEV